jgi:DNA-binding transcriptional LysR family regulator
MFENLFQKQGVSLDRLKSFYEVAKTESLIKAAGKNTNRQTLISRQIKELETYFGFSLLIRKGRTISLSPAGKDLARFLEQTFQGMSDFHTKHNEEYSSLRFVGGAMLTLDIVGKKFNEIKKIFPQSSVQVTNASTEKTWESILDFQTDFGLIGNPASSKLIEAYSLGVITCSALIPKKIFKEKPTLKSIDRIMKLPWSFHTSRTITYLTEKIENKTSLKMNIILRCESRPFIHENLRHQNCASLIPSKLFCEFPKEDFWVFDMPGLEDYKRTQYLAHHKNLTQLRDITPRQIDQLVDILKF